MIQTKELIYEYEKRDECVTSRNIEGDYSCKICGKYDGKHHLAQIVKRGSPC